MGTAAAEEALKESGRGEEILQPLCPPLDLQSELPIGRALLRAVGQGTSCKVVDRRQSPGTKQGRENRAGTKQKTTSSWGEMG